MLLFGWLASAPPATASVTFGAGAARGAWQATIWAGKNDDTASRHFVAVVQADNIVRAQIQPMLLDAPESDARLQLPPIGRIELDASPLLAPLREAGADLATIFDFLKSVLVEQSPQQPRSPRLYDFLLGFLSAISMHDGFVEILGRPDCGGLLLQGWSVHLEAGTLDFGLLCPGLDLHEAAVASFDRTDLLSTARGFVAFMKTARDVDANTLNRLYYKSQGTYYHLDFVDNRMVLQDRQAIAQLKDMIGRLRGPVAAVRALKRVCRPRFGGHETVSSLTTPVRLAQDTALCAPGAGVFVSGWLLDPCRAVCLVLLKSTKNFYARIDQTWVRLPRPDVTEAFAGNPLFAEHLRPWEQQHGFIAFVPRPEPVHPDEVFYLEVVMEDETCAFLPLKFSDGDRQTMLRQILGSVNEGDPAIDHIVATHLGPLVAALSTDSSLRVATTMTASFGRTVECPALSIVIPLPQGWSDFDINLARLSTESDLRAIEIVAVAPRSAGDAIARSLRIYAPFYDVCVTLVLSDAPLDYHEALDAGARVARAEKLLLLSSSVFPRARGWLRRLLMELQRAPDAGAISPTLLYEDESVRFAGKADMPDFKEGVLVDRFRGYGRDWLEGEEPAAIWAGTAECCLVWKELFFEIGGFSQQFVDADLKTLDFGLRLQATGRKFYWIPSVAMYALDLTSGEPAEYWSKVRRLVDLWGFTCKWSRSLSEMPCQR
jgi:hypothetical protein